MTNTELIKYAESFLGKNGSFCWNYYGRPKGEAWCAAFVSYIFDKCGYKSKWYGGSPVFYVPYAEQWMQNNWLVDGDWVKLKDAQPGDVVIFTWDGCGNNGGTGSRDHIGFVREVSGSTDYLLTIEGNTNGGVVAECKRSKKWVRNVFRPSFFQKSEPSEKSTYQGEFPGYEVKSTIPNREVLARKAEELAWSTNTKKADYPSGSATAAFNKALPKAYSDAERAKWGKAPRLGASCDVAVGVCVRASGIDPKFPRGLDEQFKWLKVCEPFDYLKADIGNLERGDIIIYSTKKAGHVCIALGNGKVAEAGYQHYWMKTTPYASTRVKTSGAKLYRACGETVSTRSYLQKGDKGDEVKKLQKYLLWYGLDLGTWGADGDFGAKTHEAVVKMQTDFFGSKEADGLVGPKTIEKMKEVKK